MQDPNLQADSADRASLSLRLLPAGLFCPRCITGGSCPFHVAAVPEPAWPEVPPCECMPQGHQVTTSAGRSLSKERLNGDLLRLLPPPPSGPPPLPPARLPVCVTVLPVGMPQARGLPNPLCAAQLGKAVKWTLLTRPVGNNPRGIDAHHEEAQEDMTDFDDASTDFGSLEGQQCSESEASDMLPAHESFQEPSVPSVWKHASLALREPLKAPTSCRFRAAAKGHHTTTLPANLRRSKAGC